MTEKENNRQKQALKMRAVMDYAVGSMIILAGFFFFFREYYDMSFNERFPPNYLDKLFGVVCVFYGGWRIYRGYKKTKQA